MSDSIVRIHTTTAAQTEHFYCRFGKDGSDRCFFIFSQKTDGLIGLLPLCPDSTRTTPTYGQALQDTLTVMQALDRLCAPGAFLFAEELSAATAVDDDFEETLAAVQPLEQH